MGGVEGRGHPNRLGRVMVQLPETLYRVVPREGNWGLFQGSGLQAGEYVELVVTEGCGGS